MPKSWLKDTLILPLIKAERDFVLDTLLRITPVINTLNRELQNLSNVTREGKLGAEDDHNMSRVVS